MKLCLPPFEPLDKTDICFCQKEGYVACTLEEGHLSWSRGGVTLIPSPGFLAKKESASSIGKTIFLPEMTSVSCIEEDTYYAPAEH
jgi:hypothetical protein